jgi:hypothetical protein
MAELAIVVATSAAINHFLDGRAKALLPRRDGGDYLSGKDRMNQGIEYLAVEFRTGILTAKGAKWFLNGREAAVQPNPKSMNLFLLSLRLILLT